MRPTARRSPLGHWAWRLVKGKGVNPAGEFLEWLRQDSNGAEDVEQLVRGLTEAACERVVHTAALATAPKRHLNHPSARRVLAAWALVAEHVRNGIANSASLWRGHRKSGMAGGMGGRLGGVDADTVGRYVAMLEASGVLRRWQPPQNTSGVVKARSGQCYAVYQLRAIPRSVVRAVRAYYERAKAPAPAPEAAPRPKPRVVGAPAPALEPAPSSRPPGLCDGHAPPAWWPQAMH